MIVKKIIKRAVSLLQPKHQTFVNVQILQPNEYLSGRTALITGGSSGIGFEIAKAYINAGATVVITGRNEQRLSDAVRALGGVKNAFQYN